MAVERCARRLAELASKQLGHRVTVRPVLAMPGWEVAPPGVGDLLLVNEENAVMLLGWSRPADHLFAEDVPALQELLARLSLNRAL